MKVFCPDLNEICDDFVNVIKQKRNSVDNILTDFEPLVKVMTLEAACTLILGRRNLLQETTDRNLHELGEATKHLFEIFRDAYYGMQIFAKIYSSDNQKHFGFFASTGNGLWKYFPSQIYRNFVRYEEKAYDIVYEIISKTLKENEYMAEDNENMTILSRILKSEGLDDRDKISGIIGKIWILIVLSILILFFNSQTLLPPAKLE